MLPVLLAWGPFQLRTLSICVLLAFITSAFVFWRKGREEHYSESELFDGFLISTVVGFVAGRVGFIIQEFDQFGWSVFAWLDLFSYPGSQYLISLVATGLYILWYAKKKKWDFYEVLDFWILAITASLTWLFLGLFFDGSNFGTATNLPWGVTFPGVFEKHHPVQLYYMLFFFALYWYLSWVEFRYRTFSWYRAGKNTAQTGFLLSMFLIFSGVFSLLMAIVSLPTFQIGETRLDYFLSVLVIIVGASMLFSRSGRSLSLGQNSRRSGVPRHFRSPN